MTIHLVITPLCNRSCEYCCNKQYDIQNLPVVTDEELKNADMLCLTGGEPFAYSNPCGIANYYHNLYPDIPIIVYTNAYELYTYIRNTWVKSLSFDAYGITGLNICVKSMMDIGYLNCMYKDGLFELNNVIGELPMNRLIVMEDMWEHFINSDFEQCEGLTIIKREWQKHFVPAPDCLFRRL